MADFHTKWQMSTRDLQQFRKQKPVSDWVTRFQFQSRSVSVPVSVSFNSSVGQFQFQSQLVSGSVSI